MSCQDCLSERAIPPIVAGKYEPKGTFQTVDGIKTYITGNKDATTALIYGYDAFGYVNQTLQGADLLAEGIPALVFMPDIANGGLPLDVLPPDTDEKKAKIQEFYAAHPMDASEPAVVAIDHLSKAIERNYPSVKKIGGFGLCFGGKVVLLANNLPDSKIAASGQGHPSRLSNEDAQKLKVPHLILASKDEIDVAAEFDKVQKPPGSEVHNFANMVHGWMGARAKLENKEAGAGYDKAYNMAAHWFRRHLS